MSARRIAEEKKVVEIMVRMYCRHKEGNNQLCRKCAEMLEYATARLSRCRFGNDKPTCHKCPVHCYAPRKRERIKNIMRWCGPRMLLYHPVAAIKHLFREMF